MDGSFDPLRRIDWRWESLDLPVASKRPNWHTVAKLVAEKFPELVTDRRRLTGRLRQAYELDSSREIDRWLLRASILAGETDEQAETRLNVPAPVVRLFESLFFNVRDRLSAGDYIRGRAISIGVIGDPVAHIGRWFAKLAYQAGPEAVDEFLPLVRALAWRKRSARGKSTCRNDRLLELAIGLDACVPGSPDERYWMRAGAHLAPMVEELLSIQISEENQRQIYKELAAELFRPRLPKVPATVSTAQPQTQPREELVLV